MINLSVNSGWFILCLISGPLIMSIKPQIKKMGFLFVNILLYTATLNSLNAVLVIIFFVFFPYVYILLLKKRDLPLWPAIIIMIGSLIYINQYGWLHNLIGNRFVVTAKLLGTSYMLFRQIDVLIQVKNEMVDNIPLIDYSNYIFSYWTLLAGPIQRYREFIKSFHGDSSNIEVYQLLSYLNRVVNGLLKVVFVGAFIKYRTDLAYTMMKTQGYSLYYFFTIFYLYPLYVYMNFSGYCDVVIGMGGWAGFNIPENFNKPYLSRSMIDFWNRWHITLSQWIRDYVYQPLLKKMLSGKIGKYTHACQYISIFFTFFLVGMWHGATVNSIICGFLYGLGMVISMVYKDVLQKRFGKQRFKEYNNNRKIIAFERIFWLHYICFTFLFYEYDVSTILRWLFVALGGHSI